MWQKPTDYKKGRSSAIKTQRPRCTYRSGISEAWRNPPSCSTNKTPRHTPTSITNTIRALNGPSHHNVEASALRILEHLIEAGTGNVIRSWIATSVELQTRVPSTRQAEGSEPQSLQAGYDPTRQAGVKDPSVTCQLS